MCLFNTSTMVIYSKFYWLRIREPITNHVMVPFFSSDVEQTMDHINELINGQFFLLLPCKQLYEIVA